MAWRNIELDITFPGIARCNITDFSLLSLTTWPNDWSPYVSTPVAVASDFNVPAGTGVWTTVMGSGAWRIDANITTNSSATIRIYMQGYNNYLGYGNQGIGSSKTWGYVAAVNDETHMGFIAFVSKSSGVTTFSKWAGTIPPYPESKAPQTQTLIRSLMYTLLTGNEHYTHNWMSVPAIQGNGGEYSINCSFIAAAMIGDGITTQTSQDTTQFRWAGDNNIYNMVKNLVDQEETICGWSGYNYFTLTRHTNESGGYFTVLVDVKFYLADGTLIWSTPSTPLIAFQRDTTHGSTTYSYLGFIIDVENSEAIFDPLIVIYEDSRTVIQYNNYGDPGTSLNHLMYQWIMSGYKPQKDNPYETGSEDNGGTNGIVTGQDDLPSNALPAVDGVNTGMFTVWKVSDQDLAHIASFLWSDDVIDNLKKYFNSVADSILGMYILPYVPSSGFGSKKFSIGNMTDEEYNNMSYMTTRYHTEDMGSFDISSIWDSYLDFAPYTKLEIYLPFCGTHELNVDELMCKAKKNGYINDTTGSTINVEYRIDCLTGACVVYLKQDGDVRYQFSGQMGTQLPVTSNAYDRMVQALTGAAAGLASTIAYAAVAAPVSIPVGEPGSKGYARRMAEKGEKFGRVAGAAAGASTAALIQSQKPSIYRNGNLTGEASMIAYDRPYLIKTRPNKPLLVDQQRFTGFPCYKSGRLGDYKYYTECLKVHLEDIPCTDNEKDAIEQMLLSGVIINPSDERSPTPDVTPTRAGNLVIAFLKNKSESECIGKKWSSTDILKIEGKLIYDQSISNPKILIEGDCKAYNYAYIPFFNRYYYISDIVVNKGVLQTVEFDVDPLQSFMSDILDSQVIVKRTGDTSKVNYYMNDGTFFTEQRQVVTYHCFKNEGSIKKFNTQQIYLITAGG